MHYGTMALVFSLPHAMLVSMTEGVVGSRCLEWEGACVPLVMGRLKAMPGSEVEGSH